MRKSTKNKKAVTKPVSEGIHEAERRKRDAVTRGITYHLDEELKQQIHALLDAYLVSHGKRKTLERYMVLDEIYGLNRPLDIETLIPLVNSDQATISQASVYNVLPLLVDAGLVRKIDLLQGKRAFYERAVGEEPHGYSVCSTCGTIKRIELTEILPLVQSQLARGFVPHDSLLVVQGECARCRKKKASK